MYSQQATFERDRPLDRKYWQSGIEKIPALGQRTLVIAWKEIDQEIHTISAQSIIEGGDGTLLGLVGIIDPPRSEAIEAIGSLMGIGDDRTVVTGEELSRMGDDELRISVQKTDVFARVRREYKLKLVQALQANGEVVAMTEDGGNDAPALKRASYRGRTTPTCYKLILFYLVGKGVLVLRRHFRLDFLQYW